MAPMNMALMAVNTTGSRPETKILFTGIANPLTTAVRIASRVPRASFSMREYGNWMIYNLSRNKERVINQFKDHLQIPKDYFFSPKKLLHISMKQFYSLESELVLERWFIEYIISPFVSFIDRVFQQIQKNGQEITKLNINGELNRQLSRGIINSETLDNLELICEKMADSFYEVKL